MRSSVLLLAVSFLAPGAAAAEAGAVEPPAEFAAQVQTLRTGSIEDRKQALNELLDTGDERVLPFVKPLIGATEEEMQPLRQQTVMGIARNFKALSADLFFSYLENGTAVEKVSVTYGLGYLNDDRVMPTLKKLAVSDHPGLRKASIYALQTIARPAYLGAQARLRGTSFALEKGHVSQLDGVREAITEILISGKADSDELYRLVYNYADSKMARELRRAYTRGLEGEQKRIGEIIDRLGRVSGRWLGRPEAPDAGAVEYTISIKKLGLAGKPKPMEFPLTFETNDVETLRGAGYYVERGLFLDLPLDRLLIMPGRGRPELLEAEEGKIRLRYDLHDPTLRVGVGTPRVGFWVGAVTPSYAIVTLDAEHGVPLSDEVFNAGGERLGKYRFRKYEEIEPGQWAPMEIVIKLPKARIGGKEHSMRYEFDFHVVDGILLLEDCKAQEETAEGTRLRASAELLDIQVLRESITQ